MRHPKRHLRLAIAAGAASACAAIACASFITAVASGAQLGAWKCSPKSDCWTFQSAPNVHPPKYTDDVKTTASQLAAGFFFVANFPNLAAPGATMEGQSGPYILDNKLQPVWFKPVPTNVVALDLKLQKFNGKPVLSWWQGTLTPAGVFTSGKDIVYDQHYRKVANLPASGTSPSTATGGWTFSGHDFVIQGNDAFVTVYKQNSAAICKGSTTPVNLLDSGVQEYNLKTGLLLGTWSACDNIPITESQQPAPSNPSFAWDAYHINSIQLVGKNEFLASMRNTWGAYLVKFTSVLAPEDFSPIQWQLGGKGATGIPHFKVGPKAKFAWQHHVVLHSNNTVSMFDDDCCVFEGTGFGPPVGPTRGEVLKLNFTTGNNPKPGTATLVNQYNQGHTSGHSAFLGSTQPLGNGNVVVGWGSQPFFSEYSKAGKLLLDALMPFPDLSYRAFKQPWVGTPFFPPQGAARFVTNGVRVFASWNGATQVASWNVLGLKAGANQKFKSIAKMPRSGFESKTTVGTAYSTFKVQALDAKGHVLGTSTEFSAQAY